MFGKRITLFRLLGVEIKADASWLFLAVLVAWSLAEGVFPEYLEGLPTLTYWTMAAVGVAGLFASIVLHELGHSLVARRCGIPIKQITLFLFGGVAEMEEEPPSAACELAMAVAGPATSLLLAAALLAARVVLGALGAPGPLLAVVSYLTLLNTVLAVFNMLPAFPLDGGRVLRAGLWSWRGDLRWATRIASSIGSGFGMLLIVLAVMAFLRGNLLGGLWWFMIGLFMRGASQTSYRQVLVRHVLEGEPIRRFMESDPVTVPRLASVMNLVRDYVYRYHYKMYPVVEGDRLVGCVTTRDVKEVPQDEWEQYTVGEIMGGCTPENSIHPDADAMKALANMSRTGASRLLVVQDGGLVGIITLKDLLGFLSLKMDLEGRTL